MAGARNKSDARLRAAEICCTSGRNMLHIGTKYVAHDEHRMAQRRVERQRLFRMPRGGTHLFGPSWNCPTVQFGSSAGKICGYKVPSMYWNSRLQFGRAGKIVYTSKATWCLKIYAESNFGWRHDTHAEICTLSRAPSLLDDA